MHLLGDDDMVKILNAAGNEVTFDTFTFTCRGKAFTTSHYESWAIVRRDVALPYYQGLFGPEVRVDEVKKH
jgi:hypothetical protein